MVLARPVVAAANHVLSFKLGEGSELTPSMIGQLYARGIECVAVAIPPPDDSFSPGGGSRPSARGSHDGGFSSMGMSLRGMTQYNKSFLDENRDEQGNIIYG